MITRKRAAKRARHQRARDMQRICFDENWNPYRKWSAPRILKLSALFQRLQRGTRSYRTARSRFLYGCRTGGQW